MTLTKGALLGASDLVTREVHVIAGQVRAPAEVPA